MSGPRLTGVPAPGGAAAVVGGALVVVGAAVVVVGAAVVVVATGTVLGGRVVELEEAAVPAAEPQAARATPPQATTAQRTPNLRPSRCLVVVRPIARSHFFAGADRRACRSLASIQLPTLGR